MRSGLLEATNLLAPLAGIVCDYCVVERDWGRAVVKATVSPPKIFDETFNGIAYDTRIGGLCYDSSTGRVLFCDHGANCLNSISATADSKSPYIVSTIAQSGGGSPVTTMLAVAVDPIDASIFFTNGQLSVYQISDGTSPIKVVGKDDSNAGYPFELCFGADGVLFVSYAYSGVILKCTREQTSPGWQIERLTYFRGANSQITRVSAIALDSNRPRRLYAGDLDSLTIFFVDVHTGRPNSPTSSLSSTHILTIFCCVCAGLFEKKTLSIERPIFEWGIAHMIFDADSDHLIVALRGHAHVYAVPLYDNDSKDVSTMTLTALVQVGMLDTTPSGLALAGHDAQGCAQLWLGDPSNERVILVSIPPQHQTNHSLPLVVEK